MPSKKSTATPTKKLPAKLTSKDNHTKDPALIVIFGASGDLAYRKLLPALYTLCTEGHLPDHYAILGVARSDYTDESFREYIREGVKEHARLKEGISKGWNGFAKRLFYHELNAYDGLEGYKELHERVIALDKTMQTSGNMLFYLSTPPSLYGTIPEMLGATGLNEGDGWRRIIIEKPFGTDLATAQELNTNLHKIFKEDQLYRIDHYLGKETVQNLMVFRFANALFEPLWNRNFIDNVQISALETVDVGTRAGYYDHAGVLRDMFQNHILQLLTLTAMEAPIVFEANPLRDEKVKVLRSIELIDPAKSKERTVRAQYEGYRKAKDVTPHSQTATFAALNVFIHNWRWQGVPFYLRSGKALKDKVSEIVIEFRETPLEFFQSETGVIPTPNRLGISVQPDEGFHLTMDVKKPGGGFNTKPVQMSFHFEEEFGKTALPEAYERLLLDALQGDAALFARSDEIEWSWRFIDKVFEGWNGPDAPPLSTYKTGSTGPTSANRLLGKRKWLDGSPHK